MPCLIGFSFQGMVLVRKMEQPVAQRKLFSDDIRELTNRTINLIELCNGDPVSRFAALALSQSMAWCSVLFKLQIYCFFRHRPVLL